MLEIKKFKDSTFEINDLVLVLDKVNDFFNPSLKDRITERSEVTNFSEYIKKVLINGEVVVACEENNITGVIMFYNNNRNSFEGYISVLAVSPDFQGLGISSHLLNFAINENLKMKMRSIRVKTWSNNIAAINLYQKFGFIQIGSEGSSFLFSKELI